MDVLHGSVTGITLDPSRLVRICHSCLIEQVKLYYALKKLDFLKVPAAIGPTRFTNVVDESKMNRILISSEPNTTIHSRIPILECASE